MFTETDNGLMVSIQMPQSCLWPGDLYIKYSRCCTSRSSNSKLENVAIANALQLEAARRRTVPIPFIFVSRAKFALAQPIRCRLRAFLLLICYVTLWPWILTPWPWPLTLNICGRRASPRSNSVRNLSEIGQSAAELLQFEYLTLWPWTRHVLRYAVG